MSNVEIKTGSEGPKHDPYHYTEVIVNRVSRDFTGTVTSHNGLGNWVKVEEDGKPDQLFRDSDQGDWFALYAGVTVKAAWKARMEVDTRRITRHPCGQRAIEEVDGMPGETLTVCKSCGKVLSGTFDLSAVI